jgi:hypothetical protein
MTREVRRTLDQQPTRKLARHVAIRRGLWFVVAAVLLVFSASAHAMIMQADDQFTCVMGGGDVSPFMQTHHASVLRLIVPYRSRSNAVDCANRAAAEGYRVYVSLQYDNAWSPARVAAYYRRTLPQYAPYAWAVSVGNEQDLVQGAPATGARYRAVWNAVEPVLARIDPRAIRVYGEASPFGFPFLEQSFRAGHPRGAQAIAFHCYDVKNGGLSVVPQVAAWAAGERLPLWCSEMSASLRRSRHPWLKTDSLSRWNALVSRVEARSPDLKMVSYYRWPEIGAL